MPNNFKYHIRKLDLLKNKAKQRRPISTNTQLHSISSHPPPAPEALIKPDHLKLPNPALPSPGSMSVS